MAATTAETPMNVVLLMAHAPLASALRDAALHVFPDAGSDIGVLDVAASAAPEDTLAQARAALAALGGRPALVLADEPTGNLDERTADLVLGQFLELVRSQGSAALIATHNERLAQAMDRVVRLHEGLLE